MISKSGLAVGVDDVVNVGTAGVDSSVIVVAILGERGSVLEAPGGSIGHIDPAGVGDERATCVNVLVGQSLDLFSHEVVAGITDAGVEVPVEGRVRRTGHALPVDAHVAVLAETAALIEILVPSAHWHFNVLAALSDAVVGLVAGAPAAHTSDLVIAKLADATLLFFRVLLEFSTCNQDA